MWNRLRFNPFLQVSQTSERRKSDAYKQGIEIKLNLTCQAQSNPHTIGILNKVFCTSGPNFVVLAWTLDDLSRGQAQNMTFKVNLTLKVNVNQPPLVQVSSYGADKQVIDTRTDRQTQATAIPDGHTGLG